MKIHTKSRDGLYEANGLYENGKVVVSLGSHINLRNAPKFTPPQSISKLRENRNFVNADGILLQDIAFDSLSKAATFVTGRIANGMIVWKTDDGKYIRYSLNGGDDNG